MTRPVTPGLSAEAISGLTPQQIAARALAADQHDRDAAARELAQRVAAVPKTPKRVARPSTPQPASVRPTVPHGMEAIYLTPKEKGELLQILNEVADAGTKARSNDRQTF